VQSADAINRVALGFSHIRQPLHGGPLVVRREVCVPGENLAAVKGFLR
jgi:hypothetical protein